MSDDDLLEQIRSWFRAAKDHQHDWRVETRNCYDFFAGNQWTDEERAELEEQLRPAISFNRIQPMVSAVKGQEINNRQEIRYMPRELGDAQVSELLTGAAQWVDDECDAEDELSEIFEDLVICGMGWSETHISFDEEIDGKIHSAERVDPLEMYWDRTAKRRNLRDAKWVARGRWIGRKEAEARWPELKRYAPEDMEEVWQEEESRESPHDASRAHLYENDSRDWYNKHKDEIFIVQCQYWEHAPFYRIGEGGRIVELSESRFNKLRDRIDEMGLRYVRQLKKEYRQCYISGPMILEKNQPWKDGFTLRCVTGKRDAMKKYWFGLVRGMIDPQRWSNKFFSDIQDMIVSNRQGGAFVEEDALSDPRHAEEHWNDPNPLIMVSPGALGAGKIQERSPIPYPQGLDRLLEWAVNALPATTGINMEMMGYTNRDQPNVLEVQRKRSALAVLADCFDAMRRFNKERGRCVLYFIQEYMNDGRLIRISGENGKDQYVPMALNPEDTRYDIIIDEAATSPNQRQETFEVLMMMAPFLTQAGIAPPLGTLDYLPLPTSMITEWKEQLQPNQEPSPQEQILMQKEQAEIMGEQADAQKAAAETRLKLAEAEAQEIENEFVRRIGLKPGHH